MNENLNERLFTFALNVLKFLPNLPKTPEMNVVRYQLAKSSTSSGANFEEAQAGSSKPDFNNKVRISLKRNEGIKLSVDFVTETSWLRIIKASLNDDELNKYLISLIDESNQLKKIFGLNCHKNK
jgi:four helix bundle protein